MVAIQDFFLILSKGFSVLLRTIQKYSAQDSVRLTDIGPLFTKCPDQFAALTKTCANPVITLPHDVGPLHG